MSLSRYLAAMRVQIQRILEVGWADTPTRTLKDYPRQWLGKVTYDPGTGTYSVTEEFAVDGITVSSVSKLATGQVKVSFSAPTEALAIQCRAEALAAPGVSTVVHAAPLYLVQTTPQAFDITVNVADTTGTYKDASFHLALIGRRNKA